MRTPDAAAARLDGGPEQVEEPPPRHVGCPEAGQVLGLHLAVDELEAPPRTALAPP